jgi:chemotaxis protein MotA
VDIATIIGLVGSLSVLMMALLLGPSLTIFYDLASLVLVFGGTFFVVCMKFNIRQIPMTIKVALNAFFKKMDKPEDLIDQLFELAKKSKKEGVLSLEKVPVEHPFLKRGIAMLVDGYNVQVIEGILNKEKDSMIGRHVIGQKIMSAIGDAAPSMGMIGTLVGLVQMLAKLDDPKSIGPAMAIAILTTLYGAIIANMIALPIVDKLVLRSEEEEKNYNLIIDGIVGIANGLNAAIIQEYLKDYLPKHLKRDKKEVDGTAA